MHAWSCTLAAGELKRLSVKYNPKLEMTLERILATLRKFLSAPQDGAAYSVERHGDDELVLGLSGQQALFAFRWHFRCSAARSAAVLARHITTPLMVAHVSSRRVVAELRGLLERRERELDDHRRQCPALRAPRPFSFDLLQEEALRKL